MNDHGRFWFHYRRRIPSSGWIGQDVHEMRFDAAEERDARAKLADVSVFEKGEYVDRTCRDEADGVHYLGCGCEVRAG